MKNMIAEQFYFSRHVAEASDPGLEDWCQSYPGFFISYPSQRQPGRCSLGTS
jgi:hypothetical protein